MEFFDGLDDSYKKLPFVVSIDEYNAHPLPEQAELFGDKDTASYALVFGKNTFIAAFVSDDLCNKLIGWCFNYLGNDSYENGKFSPINSDVEGIPFLVADKLPLLVEKCMGQNEITSGNVRFVYLLNNGATFPSNYPYTLFAVNSANNDKIIIKFEDSNKVYYAPCISTGVD